MSEAILQNETLDLILKKRSSLRQFSPLPLTKAEEEIILQAAMRAPSAANMMLYTMLVVRDAEKKKALTSSCNGQSWIADSPFVVIFLADWQRWQDFYFVSRVKEKCAEQGVDYVEPGEQSLLLASCDALLAAQNAVIAAESIGIGSCYVGHIMDHYEYHRELFDLPPYVFPVTLVAFGKPREGVARPLHARNFTQDVIVCEDSYRHLDEQALREAYSFLPFHEHNRFGAENNGQEHYLSRHAGERGKSYAEGIRSLREALRNWQAVTPSNAD